MKKRCVVWGTKARGQSIAKMAMYIGYEVVCFCSSTSSSQQKQIEGYLVVSPDELRNLCFEGKVDTVLIGIMTPKHIEEVERIIAHKLPPNIAIISADDIENVYLQKVRDRLEDHWEIPFAEQAQVWIQNFMSEVEFWAFEEANPKAADHGHYEMRMKNQDFLGINKKWGELAKTLGHQSVVMDIGCGLAPYFGTRLPNGEHIKLIGVDPLAPFYNRINSKYSDIPHRKYQFGLFEFIANFYPENYSDVIIISNALDHCIDPYKSLIECLYILKTGGKLCLEHRRSEACYAAYDGLHKWNIDYNNQNELIFWNQENAVNVTKKLHGIADVNVRICEDNLPRLEQIFCCEITKKREFQLDEFFDLSIERQNLAAIINGLMAWFAEYVDYYLDDLPEKYLNQ